MQQLGAACEEEEEAAEADEVTPAPQQQLSTSRRLIKDVD